MKEFIQNHSAKYTHLYVEYVGGDPRIAFMGKGNTQIGKEVKVDMMDSQAIHALLTMHGIEMKEGYQLESELKPRDKRGEYEMHTDL